MHFYDVYVLMVVWYFEDVAWTNQHLGNEYNVTITWWGRIKEPFIIILFEIIFDYHGLFKLRDLVLFLLLKNNFL